MKVFKLTHSRIVEIVDGENIRDTNLIGFFHSKEQAKKIKESYKFLPGFRDYPDDFFITKIIVKGKAQKGQNVFFFLQHYYEEEVYEYITNIALCSTYRLAQKIERKKKNRARFRNHSKDFIITEEKLGLCSWEEGFDIWDNLDE